MEGMLPIRGRPGGTGKKGRRVLWRVISLVRRYVKGMRRNRMRMVRIGCCRDCSWMRTMVDGIILPGQGELN